MSGKFVGQVGSSYMQTINRSSKKLLYSKSKTYIQLVVLPAKNIWKTVTVRYLGLISLCYPISCVIESLPITYLSCYSHCFPRLLALHIVYPQTNQAVKFWLQTLVIIIITIPCEYGLALFTESFNLITIVR